MVVQIVQVGTLIEELKARNNFKIGEGLLNAANLLELERPSDVGKINSKRGAYFIFSTIQKERVFSFNKDGYHCMKPSIEKNGDSYRCIYNGKANNLKTRLKQHLFISLSKESALRERSKKIPQTGAMSLETISEKELSLLPEINRSYIKRADCLNSEHNIPLINETDRFYNGIDITEKKWKDWKFGVIVLDSDNDFGLDIIEQIFREVNGMPPLCMF